MTARPARGGGDLRRGYFDAAESILAEEGYRGLKLAAVCRRVGVTTGGFYHSFESWPAFTELLLEAWRSERTTQLADLARAEADPVARLQLLLTITTGLQHRAEAAIRVWAAVDPAVQAVQEQVDEERFRVVHEAMAHLVGPDDAARFATWGVQVLVGFEMLAEHQEPEQLAWSLGQILLAAMNAAGDR